MRRRSMYYMLAPVLLLVAIPTPTWATHETRDEQPRTSLEEFRAAVGAWIDPWLDNPNREISDDHAPLVAFSLYEELLSIRPEPCYWDTYAAYWAVAADLRAMGQAPNREEQEAETVRIFEDVARAEALAELSAQHCVEMGVETSPSPDRDAGVGTVQSRVVEIEATAALQFVDENGERLDEIGVTPGETVLFRVHNTADFDHTFYIGSDSALREPLGTTDVGIATWHSGVRELEWTVPDDASGLMFGCTVPGHYSVMHGVFTSTAMGGDTSSD